MRIGDALVAIFDDHKDDPLTLTDVMKDVDSKAWQQAMDLERFYVFQSSLGTCGFTRRGETNWMQMDL